jgi:putative sterol carrier protein
MPHTGRLEKVMQDSNATTAVQPGTSRQEVTKFRDDFEQLWGQLDQFFASLGPADWQKKHGKDWVFADVPYHLSYFDREIGARPIELGRNYPVEGREALYSMGELNDWNAREFAKRPATQTVEESLAQMREVRDTLRRLLDGMTDADLDSPAWMLLAIFTGWRTVRDSLEAVRLHTWSHVCQVRLNLKRSGPMPPESATRTSVATYLSMMGSFINREAAKKVGNFVIMMDITGPAGSACTYAIENGDVSVTTGRPEKADFVMSQSPDSFVKMLNKMQNPMVAMLTGQVKVKGFSKMPTFGKLFAEPGPNVRIEPAPGALAVD